MKRNRMIVTIVYVIAILFLIWQLEDPIKDAASIAVLCWIAFTVCTDKGGSSHEGEPEESPPGSGHDTAADG